MGRSASPTSPARRRLPKSTAARLLAALAARVRSSRSPATAGYRLGPRVVTLAAGLADAQRWSRSARPYLADARRRDRRGRRAVGPRRADSSTTSTRSIRRTRSGPRLDRHADPDARRLSGQVFLAHAPSRSSRRTSRGPLERLTPRTLTDPDALRERLRAVQLDGYAWVRDEFAEGSPRWPRRRRRIRRGRGGAPRPRAVVSLPAAGRDADVGRLVATTAARIARTLRQAAG